MMKCHNIIGWYNSIKNVIGMLIFNIILAILLFKTSQPFFQFTLLGFLLCGIGLFLQIVFLLKGKINLVNFFNKLSILIFVLYVLFFVNSWCYLAIKQYGYSSLLGAIPFYGVAIYIIKVTLFGKNNQSTVSKKVLIKKTFLIVTCFLCILGGIMMISAGVTDKIEYNNSLSNYIETKGYFSSYKIIPDDGYLLNYSYFVDNKEYTASIKFVSVMLPKKNTIRMIKYNPENSSESIIIGNESFVFFIFWGIVFIIIPLSFIISKVLIMQGYFASIEDFGPIMFGIIFIAMGFFFLYSLTGSFSIIKLITDYPISSLFQSIIIILFFLFGIFIIIHTINTLIKEKRLKQLNF